MISIRKIFLCAFRQPIATITTERGRTPVAATLAATFFATAVLSACGGGGTGDGAPQQLTTSVGGGVAASPAPSASGYDVNARIAAFNARLRAVRVAAGQSDTSSFGGIALPTPPTITNYVTVTNAMEMAVAAAMNNVQVTFAGRGFSGTLSLGSRTDQRWIFPAGFTLTAPRDDYAIAIGTSRRVELIGTGGNVAGGMHGANYSDLKIKGMDIRTQSDNAATYLESHSLDQGTRVLIEGSFIYSRSYALLYADCSNFIVANSEVRSAGGAATARTSRSDLVLWLDSRLVTDGQQMMFRAHENTNRFAAWNVQMEGSTGVYVGPAGTAGTNARDVVLLDNSFYVSGAPITADYTVNGSPNVTMATIVGNRGYTNWDPGSQLNTGNTGPGWIVTNNPWNPAASAPAWHRQ